MIINKQERYALRCLGQSEMLSHIIAEITTIFARHRRITDPVSLGELLLSFEKLACDLTANENKYSTYTRLTEREKLEFDEYKKTYSRLLRKYNTQIDAKLVYYEKEFPIYSKLLFEK